MSGTVDITTGLWSSAQQSKINQLSLTSIATSQVGIDFRDIRMAVLVQRVVPAAYAFVIHTTNPSNGAPHRPLLSGARQRHCDRVRRLYLCAIAHRRLRPLPSFINMLFEHAKL